MVFITSFKSKFKLGLVIKHDSAKRFAKCVVLAI